MPIFTAPTGIKNVSIGYISRNAAGTQSITGVGFKPKIVLFLAHGVGGTYQIASWGFDDAVNCVSTYLAGNSVDASRSSTYSIVAWKTNTAYIRGYISSMDSDGFTLSWALTGTMTAYAYYLAMA